MFILQFNSDDDDLTFDSIFFGSGNAKFAEHCIHFFQAMHLRRGGESGGSNLKPLKSLRENEFNAHCTLHNKPINNN